MSIINIVRSTRRDSPREFLQKREIGTLIHYPVPLHRQPAYRDWLRCVGSIVNTHRIVNEILSLLIYTELSLEKVRQVAEIIVSWDSEGV